MSFIDVEFTRIQFPDIMADSIDATQILLPYTPSLAARMALYSPVPGSGALIKTIVARLDKPHQLKPAGKMSIEGGESCVKL
jgi:hypothetical protein